jgi:hypothetical protein
MTGDHTAFWISVIMILKNTIIPTSKLSEIRGLSSKARTENASQAYLRQMGYKL